MIDLDMLNKQWPALWKLFLFMAVVVLAGIGGVEFIGFGLHVPDNEHRYFLILVALLCFMALLANIADKWAESQRQQHDARVRAAQIEAGGSGDRTIITERGRKK